MLNLIRWLMFIRMQAGSTVRVNAFVNRWLH